MHHPLALLLLLLVSAPLYLRNCHAIIIEDKCSPREKDAINAWLQEARHILDRAVEMLQRYPSDAGRIHPGLESQFKRILGERHAIPAVADEMKDLFAAVRRNMDSSDVDIQIWCDDYVRVHERVWQRGGRVKSRLAYKLPFSRINGRAKVEPDDDRYYEYGGISSGVPDSLYLEFSKAPDPDDNASAFGARPDSQLLEDQFQLTDSRHLWTNIWLSPNLFRKDDYYYYTWDKHPSRIVWDPELFRDRFGIHRSPIYRHEFPASSTILHELFHSIAHPKPIQGHVQVDGRDANTFQDIMDAAKNDVNDCRRNPGSLAFLAFSLTMPWFIFWDEDYSRPADGLLRYNRVHPMNPDGSWAEERGLYVRGRNRADADTERQWKELKREMAKGPYADL